MQFLSLLSFATRCQHSTHYSFLVLPWSITLNLFRTLSVVFCRRQAVRPFLCWKAHRLGNLEEVFIPNIIPLVHTPYSLNPFINVFHSSIGRWTCYRISTNDANRNKKNNRLTLFFNICRFVLLFPTFLQQKGLSNSFRIRRAWWFNTKRVPLLCLSR